MQKKIVFLTCCFACIFLFGCGNKEVKKEKVDKSKLIYSEQPVELDKLVDENVERFAYSNGKIYVHTYSWDETGTTLTTKLYSLFEDGKDIKEIPFMKLTVNDSVEYMDASMDGTVATLLSSYDENEKTVDYSLIKTDATGSEQMNIHLTDIIKDTDSLEIKDLCMDNKGNCFLAENKKIYGLDTNGNLMFSIDAKEDIIAIAKNNEDSIWIVTEHEGNPKLQSLNIEQGKLITEETLDGITIRNAADIKDGNGDFDLYYLTDSDICGFSVETKKSTPLMDYIASSIDELEGDMVVPMENNRFLVAKQGEILSETFSIFENDGKSKQTDKQIITYGGININPTIKKFAVAFNKENEKYQIEFRDYSDQEDSREKMTLDILTGDAPDIICLDGLPKDLYVQKGVLTELSSFYNNDTDVHLEDILEPVLKASKIQDGYYYVAPMFSLDTIIARASDVGSAKNWTIEDLQSILDKKKKETVPFYCETKEEMLEMLLMANYYDYIDLQEGTCNFDNEEFRNLLKLCKNSDVESLSNDTSTNIEQLEKGGQVLVARDYLSMEKIQYYQKLYGENINIIGYPNNEGNGTYLEFDYCNGIYSKSENKEGAWAFLRMLLMPEFQNVEDNFNYLPSRKDCFADCIERYKTKKTYTDSLGQTITPFNSVIGSVELGPVSEEEVALFEKTLNETYKVKGYNQEIFDIIFDEVNGYLRGTKSLDKTIEQIQNRAQTYINENR